MQKKTETTVEDVLNILQPEQRSPEWYALREQYLTSSDLGAVLGLNKYQSRDDVLLKKSGRKEHIISDDTAIKHGQFYEKEAIEVYCDIFGRTSYDVGLIPFASLNKTTVIDGIDCSFLAGSADGITILRDKTNGKNVLNVIEVKCPYYRWPKYGCIPEYYYPQLQMNMHILNINVGDFIEYYPVGFQGECCKMNVVRVYKDEMWLRHVLPTLHEFWNEVLLLRKEGKKTIKMNECTVDNL